MITIEEFKNKITKKSRLIGLDLGSKRIGIAICDEYQSIATPFKTLQKDNFNKFYNQKIILITGAKQFVVQDAIDITKCLVESYSFSLTPNINVTSGSLDGADIITL